MRLRIYTDTSVIGGCEDEEFREHSQQLLAGFVRGDFTMVISDLTLRELDRAPATVREVLARVPDGFTEILSTTDEVEELASAYIEEGVLAESSRADAFHIAMATLAKVDVLASWNFRHIVNLKRIHGFNSVNLRRGLHMIEIRSPREVLPSE